jgi:hypothetical protein
MATEKSIGSPKSGHGIEGDWSVNEPDGLGEVSEEDRRRSVRVVYCAGSGIGSRVRWDKGGNVVVKGEIRSVTIGTGFWNQHHSQSSQTKVLTSSRFILLTRSLHESDSRLLPKLFQAPECLFEATSLVAPFSFSLCRMASLSASPLFLPAVRSAILGCRLKVRILRGCFSFAFRTVDEVVVVLTLALLEPDTIPLLGFSGSGLLPAGSCELGI